MKTTTNPHYEGFFLYGDGKPHCWSGPGTSGDRLKEMAQHIMAHKPDGATTPWWRGTMTPFDSGVDSMTRVDSVDSVDSVQR